MIGLLVGLLLTFADLVLSFIGLALGMIWSVACRILCPLAAHLEPLVRSPDAPPRKGR